MPDRSTIADFLAQKHVAVVGVSRHEKDFSRAVYRRLKGGGRTLYPVTASGEGEIEGDRSYASLAEISHPLDGVIVMVSADRSADVVRDAITAQVPRVWLHKGSGPGAVSDEAVQLCRESGMPVIDGACPLMFDEPVKGIHRMHRVLVGRSIG